MQLETGFVVQVVETLNKFHRLVRDILVTVLAPTLVIALVSVGLLGSRRAWPSPAGARSKRVAPAPTS